MARDSRLSCPISPRMAARRESALPGLYDRAGEWWVPGEAGLYRFARTSTIEELARTRPKAIYTTQDGLAGDDILRLFEDSRGDIWIARRAPTRAVLTRWDRASEDLSSTITKAMDCRHSRVRLRSVKTARAASGWASLAAASPAIAMAASPCSRRPTVHQQDRLRLFYSDANGRLWIGSSLGGVGRVDDPDALRPRFVRYTTAEGLTSDKHRQHHLGSRRAPLLWNVLRDRPARSRDRPGPPLLAAGRTRRHRGRSGLSVTGAVLFGSVPTVGS